MDDAETIPCQSSENIYPYMKKQSVASQYSNLATQCSQDISHQQIVPAVINHNASQNSKNSIDAMRLAKKIQKTMQSTSKCDKYVRLACNIIKFVRLSNQKQKKKYAHIYKQMLILRQVIRWQGLYSTIVQLYENYPKNMTINNLSNLSFSLLEIFGDILDRIIYITQILQASKNYIEKSSQPSIISCLFKNIAKIEQLQSDCYFVQCIIWLLFHIRTLKKVWKQGNQQDKINKVLKVVKYVCDTLTSYCKFSKRVKQIQPRNAAVLGILSSIIGVYDILK